MRVSVHVCVLNVSGFDGKYIQFHLNLSLSDKVTVRRCVSTLVQSVIELQCNVKDDCRAGYG